MAPNSGPVVRRSRRASFLGTPFFAAKERNRLRNRGDLIASRKAFLASTFNNLDYLLRTRYAWMNEWIKDADVVVEIGAGAGFSPRYLHREVMLTDVVANDWLNAAMDGTRMAFRDGSVDAVIVSNALHHFPYPAIFLLEASRVLKDGGLVLINDAYCSLLLRIILRLARHEGYSYDVDVFDPSAVANDPEDPWSGNNAVSNLLFDGKEEFESRFPGLHIVFDAPCETLLFLASGGVTSKVSVPQLPTALLDCLAGVDRFLVATAPSLFALSRRTVLRKARPNLPR